MEMENSQGDKVPIKILIGPPLPPGGPGALSRRSESLELGGVVSDPSIPVPSHEETDPQQEVCSARQCRRNMSELCKDLEAHLRGLRSEDDQLPETLTGDTETLTGDTETPVKGTEVLTQAAENLTEHMVAPVDREVLVNDAEDLKGSFSQDFSEQRRPESPVPELPPLEVPESWLPSLRGPGPWEVTFATELLAPSPGQPTSTDSAGERDEQSSPFEELLLPPPDFDYHEMLSGTAWTQEEYAAPQWQEVEARDTTSSSVEEEVKLQGAEQQPGALDPGTSPSLAAITYSLSVAETAPRQLQSKPQCPLSASWTKVSLDPLFLLGPCIELDVEEPGSVEALAVHLASGEREEVFVQVMEPCASGYAVLEPPPTEDEGTRSAGAAWCCTSTGGFTWCSTRPATEQ